MNRLFSGFSAVLISLALSSALTGCKDEPPPSPEKPDLSSLRERLEATKQEQAEAQKKIRETEARLEAERLAKQRAANEAKNTDAGSEAAPATSGDATGE